MKSFITVLLIALGMQYSIAQDVKTPPVEKNEYVNKFNHNLKRSRTYSLDS